MKTKLTLLITLACLLLAASVAANTDRIDKRVAELTDQLKLTEDQSSRVREILVGSSELAVIDKERYRGNRTAMKKAADERIELVNSQIKEVLTDEQKAEFVEIKPPRDSDRERPADDSPFARQIQGLTDRLNLTEEQQVQLADIYAAHADELSALREGMGNRSGDRSAMKQKREAMKAVMDEINDEIENILDDAQNQEFEAWKSEQQQRRGKGGQRGGGRGGRRGGN